MLEEVEKAIATLRDPRAGWATRKEAAQTLGVFTRQALFALRDHKDDADRDVRDAVVAELKQMPLAKRSAVQAETKQFGIDELAQACAKKETRTVIKEEGRHRIEVRIDEARTQDVFLESDESDGKQLLRVFTKCGKPDASSAAWALRTNSSLVGCAFAVENHDRFEHLILIQNLELAKATPEDVLAAVRQVAFYGDWIEKKLTGGDEY